MERLAYPCRNAMVGIREMERGSDYFFFLLWIP